MIVGIDVGGTNTDVAFLSENQVKTFKFPNEYGVENILNRISREVDIKRSRLIISTSVPLNALTSEFDRIKVLSLVFPGPGLDYSRYGIVMRGYVNHRGIYVEEINEEEIVKALEGEEYDALAISSKFSIRNPVIEHKVSEVASNFIDGDRIALSHHVGLINFPLRINTTILNAKIAEKVKKLTESVKEIKEEFFYYKGDGGIIPWQIALRNPLELYNSSPAAVAYGAYFLTGIKDALVIDIGGTTTDLVLLKDGSPEVEEKVEINGMRTHVRCVRSFSLPYGGDSLYSGSLMPYRDGKSVAFGGDAPTLTDLLNALGAEIGSFQRSREKVGRADAEREVERYVNSVAEVVRNYRVKTIIGTGYLAQHLVPRIAEAAGRRYTIPEHYGSANAVGVAVSRISLTLYARFDTERRLAIFNGEVDQEQFESISGHPDDDELVELAIERAKELALKYGANERDLADIDVMYFNSFNIVKGGIKRGKIVDIIVQIKPGLCCDVV
ncbi:hydantoinase/oxoprolinase family protein [Geoglobus acetivorans]|uniref:Hydantoinase/oxoprolinase family protein n=1 Tax=Geoglobus acetivorans TaxID=565033 RepID=A0ABZ3H4K8_GEOAI|nr:hydantoinase/oxoprolinase family protein [Geoglobus acetivorans]